MIRVRSTHRKEIRLKRYIISYRLYEFDKERSIEVVASNKSDAYCKAVFDIIPSIENEQVYSAWIDAYITKSGEHHQLNTCEGFPY